MNVQFDRDKHVYKSDAFEEIIKDTIRFFNGTPVHNLPPPEKFHGTGVYAIYYTGKSPYYKPLYKLNRLEYAQPIYIGKAVPSGWRQARITRDLLKSYELFGRLKEHGGSISAAKNLEKEDFKCRFMILEGSASHMIGTVEAALIRHYLPIWNTSVDGFGNHDPGSGRYNQAKSEWDILHPGRNWAERCLGQASTLELVEKKIKLFFNKDKNA